MTITVEAIYEGGVLRPVKPLPLEESDRVRLTVESLPTRADGARLNLAQWFSAIEANTGLIDGPADWAARHDDYLLGSEDGASPNV